MSTYEFYTVAFLKFVPVGYRFAALAWLWHVVDKPLAVIAGVFIGITAVVTLLRFWNVEPRQVVTAATLQAPAISRPAASSTADEYMAATRRRAAENRDMATGARVLGSTTGHMWHH